MKDNLFLPIYTRLCCILVGDDYNLLARIDDAKSNKKIQMFAMLILLPMMLWGMTIYLIMKNVFMASLVPTTLAFIATLFIVGVVQRSLIMSKGNFMTTLIRYAIAIALALMGSFLIDEVIFEKDIHQKIIENHKLMLESKIEKSKSDYENKTITPQEKVVSEKQKIYNEAIKRVGDETSGLKGTGIKGSGAAVRVLKEQEQAAKQTLEIEQKRLNSLREGREHFNQLQAEQIKKEEAINDPSKPENINSIGLMYKIGAMFELILSKWYMMIFWSGLTLLFFLFEMLPVFIKMNEEETFYEKLVNYHSLEASEKLKV